MWSIRPNCMTWNFKNSLKMLEVSKKLYENSTLQICPYWEIIKLMKSNFFSWNGHYILFTSEFLGHNWHIFINNIKMNKKLSILAILAILSILLGLTIFFFYSNFSNFLFSLKSKFKKDFHGGFQIQGHISKIDII